MRTLTILFSALVLGTAAQAQTVATFDDLLLSKPDTSYINYSASGSDVGFNDGLAHFPTVYDTSFGGIWNYCSYSNWTDSVTSGYTNQYSAKTGIGYAGSANYMIAYCANPVTYEYNMNIKLNGAAVGEPVSGFYVTNSTYAYNYMRDHPFDSGGWFVLTIKGYIAGALTADSVNYYLADYRASDSSLHTIVRTWEWVNLLSLGAVDSLQFSLNSTDTAGGFGMNTPGYFCMDNFTTHESSSAVSNVANTAAAKVYPNPATNVLCIDVADNATQQINILDMAGNVVSTYAVTANHTEINTAPLSSGTYMLQLSGNGKTATTRFVKK